MFPSALGPPTQAIYYNQPTFNSHIYPSFQQEPGVFSLKHLQGTRICICYGCGHPIRTDLSYIPPPPHNVVVSYRERWYYRDSTTTHEMLMTPTEENMYYHLMFWCITRKHPMFHGSMLKIPESLLSLQDVHCRHIMEQFGIHSVHESSTVIFLLSQLCANVYHPSTVTTACYSISLLLLHHTFF